MTLLDAGRAHRGRGEAPDKYGGSRRAWLFSCVLCEQSSTIQEHRRSGARTRGLNGLQGPLREVTYGPDESKPEPNALRLRAP